MTRVSLNNINCWEDFKSYVEAMPNTKGMGDSFEQLTKLYFLIDPIYQSKYQDVWLLDEVPAKDLEYLELPRQDLGIDLIARSGSEYHAIQCKYHSNKNSSVSNKEISTFTSLLANKKNLTHGYICSTALNTSRNFNKLEIQNISNILYDTWSTLDQEFFDNARKILEKKKPKVTPFIPKPHQKNAITLAHKHFVKENNSRGKLIFPCGSGKSLTGFWMMEKLKANSTVVAVPSLSLVKQTLEVYLKQVVAKNKNVKWLCICSDEGIGKSDDVVTYSRDLPVPCTTDPDYIKNWLKDNKNDNIIIFTTYQSGRLIAEASKSLKFTFDLGVYDEAHKTVGKNENLFSYLLFEENISVKHRIFMTATERFYRGVKDDVLTMDDPDDYGDVFCHMSFKEAIEEDLLTDYKIITIEVKKEEIAGFIKDNNLVKSNAKWGKENEARSLASMIALRKAMKRFPIKNAVSFHSSIERATRNKDVQKHITDTYNYKPIDTYHVSGKLPTTKRNDVVQEFAKSDRALITNSRCLTEGVDVPNIDCIVFADPRKSKVDIVQALGRALRKKPGKDWGYVVLPVIYDHTSHEIDNENFQEILNVIRGLAANDERIIEEFKDKSQNSSRVVGARKEIFSVDPELLKESELVDNLNIKLWEKLSRFNWMPFEEARSLARKLNYKSSKEWFKYISGQSDKIKIPTNPNLFYKNSGWVNWADFLGHNYISVAKREYLKFDDARDYVRSLSIKSQAEFEKFTKSKKFPTNIPKDPSGTYKNNGWIDWGDWLGSGFVIWSKRKWRPFEEAREYAKSLNLKSWKDWSNHTRGINFPKDIPKQPRIKYLDEGWISVGDWLGTGRIADHKKNYIDYNEAKKFARTLNLKSSTEWKEYIKTHKLNNIPINVSRSYKDKGFKSWSDFLGYKSKSSRQFASFKEAKKTLWSFNITSRKEFRSLIKSGKIPENIPTNPSRVYKDCKGWISEGDFVGYNKGFEKTSFLSFNEARDYVRKLKIKSWREWKVYCQSSKKPSYIPKAPEQFYKNKGWLSAQDWFGTKQGFLKHEYLSFSDARTYVRGLNLKNQKEWKEFSLSGKRPDNIPSNPNRTYKNKGWIGLADFLGKKD